MKSSTSIKYKYAFNSKKQVVYVKELQRSTDTKNEVFTCISCENILIPKLGEVKQKHFAHKHVQNCSEETYLHKLAKLIFEQEYNASLSESKPFYIELKIDRRCNAHQNYFGKTCRLESINRHIDLTKRYKKISLETRIDEFIPDILLSNMTRDKMLFIEIAVTHRITDKKAEAKFPIIEVNIETEEDLSFIKERVFSLSNPKIKLINFNIKLEEGKLCGDFECPEKVGIFRVYKNGKSILTWESLPKAKSLIESQSKNSFLYHKVINRDEPYSLSDEYKKNLIDAYNSNIEIKNCFLCRYHGKNQSCYDDDKKPIFCKFLKISCNSNRASECQYYRPDQKNFPDL